MASTYERALGRTSVMERLVLVVVAAFVGYLCWRTVCGSTTLPDDLQVYRGAGQAWLDHGDPYRFSRSNGDTFSYPPFAILPLVWVAVLPAAAVSLVWLCASIAATGACAFAIAARTGSSWVYALALLLLAGPGRSNLHFGQISVFVFALCVLDACAVTGRWRGITTGVAAALKLTPLPFLVLLGARREWAAAVRGFVALTLASIVGWLMAPAATSQYLHSGLLGVGTVPHWDGPGNQSIRAALSRVGVAGPWWFVLATLTLVLAIGVAARVDAACTLAAWSLVGIAVVLASPISWTHHRYWVLVPLLIPGVWHGRSKKVVRAVLVVAAVVNLAPFLCAVVTYVLLLVAVTRHPNVAPPRDRIEVWQR